MRFRSIASIPILMLVLTFGSDPSKSIANIAAPGLAAGCDASAPAASNAGFPEVRGIAKHAKLWALLFYHPPAAANTDLKIVLRMTGTGPLHVKAIGPAGRQVRPQWVEKHGGSNWNRPGNEWGTGWRLPTAGCWRLHATRKRVTGNVWLMVVPNANSLTAAAARTIAAGSSTWLQGWPMYGHDPQRTNRSPDVGPTQPRLVFRRGHVYSQPLVDSSGSIFTWSAGGLLSLGPAGSRRWVYPASEGDAGGPPALTPTGMVEMVGYPTHIPRADPLYSRIFGIAPSGHVKWTVGAHYFSKGAAPYATGDGFFVAPFVGPNSGRLDVVSSRGKIVRHLNQGSFYSVAQAPDGTIYAFLKDNGLVAFDSHGHPLWERDLGVSDGPNLSILVGQQGTIYAANAQGVVAFDAAGNRLWQVPTSSSVIALAESGDGSLLVADEHSLSNIDASGRTVWQLAIGSSTLLAPEALAVDGAGKIYLLGVNGVLHMISPTGEETSQQRICSTVTGRPALALGPDGRLVTLCSDGVLRVYGG
jgi:hypothetical protein